ncbi:MAG: SH3 domain-containing protein [Calditrichaeota bacterium]|nr:SH3 domain-containing protein [Calditrichota bacterium]
MKRQYQSNEGFGQSDFVRRFSLFLGLMTLTLFVYCSPEFISQPNRLVVQTATVVRSGPGAKYKEIATVKAGTQLFLLESENDWHRVELPDGRRGWIFQGVARKIGREKVVVLKENAKVRRGPGEEYSAFAIIKKGKELLCDGERGNWFYVELIKGRNGWISKKDAEKVSFRNVVTIKATYAYRDADRKSGILLNISEGAELVQLGKVGAFYQIRLPGGQIGYVHESAVDVVRERTIRVKDRAVLRRGSNEGYGVVDTLEVGMQLTKLTQKGDWIEVKTSDGRTGWIHKSAVATTVSSSGEEFIEEKPVYLITNQDSNIREKPGTKQAKLTRVKKGKLLLKLGQENDWIKIKLADGRIGWIWEPLVDYDITLLLTKLDCNIRFGPSTRYQLIKRASKGMPLVRLEERNGWTRVRFDEGDIGWIKNGLFVPLDSLLFANRDCNVRKGPGTQYERIERILYGTFVYYLGKTKDWYKIRLIPDNETEGKVGYIQEDLLSLSGNEFRTNERANIRKGPSTDYAIIANLPPQSRLRKIGEKKDWVHVRLDDKRTGWVYKKLVSYAFSPYPRYKGSARISTLAVTLSPPVLTQNTETPATAPVSASAPTTGAGNNSYWKLSTTKAENSSYGSKEQTKIAVNFRTQPDTSASIIMTLPPQTLLTKIAPSGEWWEVMTQDGVYGWVHQVAFGLAETKYLYAQKNANIRYGPGTNYKIIDQARAGDVFTRMEKRGKWYYVQYKNSKRGWIREDLVDVQRVAPGLLPEFTSIPAYGRAITRVNSKLYKGPSKNYPAKRNLPQNTYLKIVGKFRQWTEVELLGNLDRGWVPNADILNKYHSRIITVKDAEVYVAPNTQSGLVTRVRRALTFRPIDQRNEWFRIVVGGQTGWINLRDVAALKYPDVYVNQPEVNVRRLPDIQSKKIAVLKEGTKLKPTDDEGDWLFVKMPRGDKSWIHKKLVDLQEFPYVIVTSDANVYQKPTAGSILKGRVKREERFLALNKNSNWYKISYRTDDVGWIYAGFVKEDVKGTQLIRERTELRMGPGKDYELIGYVKKGTQAKWLNEVNKWRQVEVKTRQRWLGLFCRNKTAGIKENDRPDYGQCLQKTGL